VIVLRDEEVRRRIRDHQDEKAKGESRDPYDPVDLLPFLVQLGNVMDEIRQSENKKNPGYLLGAVEMHADYRVLEPSAGDQDNYLAQNENECETIHQEHGEIDFLAGAAEQVAEKGYARDEDPGAHRRHQYLVYLDFALEYQHI